MSRRRTSPHRRFGSEAGTPPRTPRGRDPEGGVAMSEVDSLLKRMDAEFEAAAKRKKEVLESSVKAATDRDALLAQFQQHCDRLRDLWKPRREAFVKRFGEKVKVTPALPPTQREAAMVFTTGVASVTLKLTASAATESGNLVLDYDLAIVPVLMDYERHARLETPIGKVDAAKVGAWIDDRLIAFLKTYQAMFETEAYLKNATVEDPVSKVRFPRPAAAASLVVEGRTYYFASAETKAQFEAKTAAAKAAKDAGKPAAETSPKPAAKAATPPAPASSAVKSAAPPAPKH